MRTVGELALIDKAREARLKRLYGLTIAQYEAMLKKQGGGCVGCGRVPKEGQRRLHVDHDHKTGKVRCICCWRCNRAIQMIRDDPAIAYNLFKMLQRHYFGGD